MKEPYKASTVRRVDAESGPWPLHGTASAREAEQAAHQADPQRSLMAMAGLSVARLALVLAPQARSVRVFAGPGNNGGDGLVAARHLHAVGKQVRVSLQADAARLPADAAHALREAQAAGVAISTGSADAGGADLLIDALLGLGASRAPEGAMAAAIRSMNAAAATLLAVDVPSGLHSDTGALLGDVAVNATATLSLLTLKAGCFTNRGIDHAGTVWFDDLGIAAAAPLAWLSAPPVPASRLHASNKGSFGNVAVVAGAADMLGAAWLAARAASAAGAGKVYLSPLDTRAPLLDPQHPELIGHREFWRCQPALLAKTTVVCGCGGGDGVLRTALPPLLAHATRLLLDADALNAVAADADLLRQLQARAGRGQATLLTPHPLEAARLLQCAAQAVQADRLSAAQAIAAHCRAAVLLKGSGSIVAASDRVPQINPTGNAALATAGTGDVLAGWAGGLWAQQPNAHPAEIAATAAWQHGRAADLYAPASAGAPLRASELVERLALRQWR
ncbi:MAG: NAD(P)H-hydrate dehydratase [Pseudomonadota bacterium]|nr:NAD(P)H-hydrate dehydratase [Pseudomonadota bacterium]